MLLLYGQIPRYDAFWLMIILKLLLIRVNRNTITICSSFFNTMLHLLSSMIVVYHLPSKHHGHYEYETSTSISNLTISTQIRWIIINLVFDWCPLTCTLFKWSTMAPYETAYKKIMTEALHQPLPPAFLHSEHTGFLISNTPCLFSLAR